MIYRILAILCFTIISYSAISYEWQFTDNKSSDQLIADKEGVISTLINFPNSAQIFITPERVTFRPKKENFLYNNLEVEIKLDLPEYGTPPETLVINLFIKDKDGYWFQSIQDIIPTYGKFQKISIPISETGKHWRPVGHNAVWNTQYAVSIFNAGVTLYCQDDIMLAFSCRNLKFTGERQIPELSILDWQLPDKGEKYSQLSSTFRLTREYFNPFDPEEIQVDFEIISPNGRTETFPAFYNQDFIRSRNLTQEFINPQGMPFWEFRFLPKETGEYQLRILLKDENGTNISSPWKKINIKDSMHRGPIRVSKKNHRFFEFSNGDFFYPIGLNLSSNIDTRSQYRFGFGHLPNIGTYDYDVYFNSCAANGINTAEIWMASWTYGLEWDAARKFYYGVGRYNLANAWCLDYIIETANNLGIFVNLVFDNHGKASSASDAEWDENPFNSKAAFAIANGGFLNSPNEYFKNKEVLKYTLMRNRYIAARWGANPGIFAVEQWSEIDLVSSYRTIYNDGSLEKWHAEAAKHYSKNSQAKHLITTHTCGDWNNSLNSRRLFELPEHSHWAGDAYRNPQIHIVDQMRNQERNLRTWKPVLITEYGGTSTTNEKELIVADLHGGLWSSAFKNQAGTPLLWWHDFVHINNHYQHYYGFSKFMNDVDLRPFDMSISEPSVIIYDPTGTLLQKGKIRPQQLFGRLSFPFSNFLFKPIIKTPDQHFESLAIGNNTHVYGWVFNHLPIYRYPNNKDIYFPINNLAVALPYKLIPGKYKIRFYDTMSGAVLHEFIHQHPGGKIQLPLPPIQIDIAFKLEKIK